MRMRGHVFDVAENRCLCGVSIAEPQNFMETVRCFFVVYTGIVTAKARRINGRIHIFISDFTSGFGKS